MLDVTFYYPRVMMVTFSFSSQDGRGGNSTILRLGGDGRMRGRESVVAYFVVILRCNLSWRLCLFLINGETKSRQVEKVASGVDIIPEPISACRKA